MNLLETYVSNITKEERLEKDGIVIYKIVADINCYGDIHKQKEITLGEYQYKSVKERGYYLGQKMI